MAQSTGAHQMRQTAFNTSATLQFSVEPLKKTCFVTLQYLSSYFTKVTAFSNSVAGPLSCQPATQRMHA